VNKLFQFVLPALLLFPAFSCRQDRERAQPGRPTVAVIPKGTTHEFWKSVRLGAEQAGKEFKVEIIWKGPLKEDDRESQIRVVEDFISRGVSGIVLAPLDEVALQTVVRNAVRAGIPVAIIDSGLKGEDYIGFIATDNYQAGVKAGERMASRLQGKGRVVMLRYNEGSQSTASRERGFLDAIAKTPAIQVVSSNQYGGVTAETATRASENLLAPLKNPDGSLAIDGIFCPNESTTFGMLRALENNGLVGKAVFVGFDSSTQLARALRQGEIDALVLQNPKKMGYLGVAAMARHLRGEKVEKRIDTGVALATRENLDQPEMRALLDPLGSQ
jgi:ribose transport system substrate-binding protein